MPRPSDTRGLVFRPNLRKIDLGYRDPASIRLEDFADREAKESCSCPKPANAVSPSQAAQMGRRSLAVWSPGLSRRGIKKALQRMLALGRRSLSIVHLARPSSRTMDRPNDLLGLHEGLSTLSGPECRFFPV